VTAENPARPGTLLTHRIIAQNPDGTFVTQGDANPSQDLEPITRDAIHGRAFIMVPWVGLPAMWVKTHNILPLGLTAAGLLVLGLAVRDHRARRGAPAAATLVLAVLATAAVAGPATVGRSAAFLTQTVSNSGNRWATGPAPAVPTSPLLDNDGGAAMFRHTSDAAFSTPGGSSLQRVVKVTYDPSGSYVPDLRLHATNEYHTDAGDDIAKWLRVKIERGTGGAAFPSANGFNPSQTTYVAGLAKGVVYDGSLADLKNSHGRWAPVNLFWSPSGTNTQSFRFTVTLDAPSYQTDTGNVGVDFVWFDYKNQWADPQTIATVSADNSWGYRKPVGVSGPSVESLSAPAPAPAAVPAPEPAPAQTPAPTLPAAPSSAEPLASSTPP
jgi:hypothetical protein